MFFGYIYTETDKGFSQVMALIPDKITADAKPIPVFNLKATIGSFLFLSPEEAVKIIPESDGGFQISPQLPAKMYVTPNRAEKPGLAVEKVKVKSNASGDLDIFVDRTGKGWEAFTPESKDY